MTHKKIAWLKSCISGGQFIIHTIRMAKSTLITLLRCCAFIIILLFVAISYFYTESKERHNFYRYHLASIIPAPLQEKYTFPILTSTKQHTLTGKQIVNSQGVHYDVAAVYSDVKVAIKHALLLGVLGLFGSILVLYRYGKKQQTEELVRGVKLVESPKLTNHMTQKKIDYLLKIGGIPLPKAFENRSFLFLGAPGVGKTQAIYQLLDYVRQQQQPAIIYDVEGVFTSAFYQEGKDIILNIADARCAPWTVWTDCHEALDYDELAATLIPHPAGSSTDPFWTSAARIILSVSMQEMAKEQQKDTGELLRNLTMSNLNRIQELGKGTIIESLTAEKIERLALSVKSMLATHLNSLRFLVEGENEFSIRKWVKEPQNRWVFISSREEHQDSLAPLMTAWMNIASKAILSLDEDINRRLWVIADEMHTLDKITAFERLLPRARKRGCCLVIGLQDIATLEHRYGPKVAQVLSSNVRTRLFYGCTDIYTAEWVSRTLGRQELTIPKEAISYGTDTLRDSASFQQDYRMRPLVLPEEIMSLPDFTAYLQLPGDYPCAKISIPYVKRTLKAPAFIPRQLINLMENVASSTNNPPIKKVDGNTDETPMEHSKKIPRKKAQKTHNSRDIIPVDPELYNQ